MRAGSPQIAVVEDDPPVLADNHDHLVADISQILRGARKLPEMKKTAVVSMAMLALLTACGSVVETDNIADAKGDVEAAETVIEPTDPETLEESEFSRNLNENFRANFTTNFVKSCVAEALKSGAPENTVRPVCECTSGELLKRVNSYAESANPSREKMVAAASFCFKKLPKN